MRSALTICLLLSLITLMRPQSDNQQEKIYNPGSDGVTRPIPIFTPEPQWSEESRKSGVKGDVVLTGYVGADGKLHAVEVIRSLHPAVDADTLEGVKPWKFRPCTKDGQAVNCKLNFEVAFHID
jgi:protein TonB